MKANETSVQMSQKLTVRKHFFDRYKPVKQGNHGSYLLVYEKRKTSNTHEQDQHMTTSGQQFLT